MLKIDRIVVDEFRGLRHVDLNLRGRNHVVVGPNGSGKSGIVDAIDFAFTGKLSRFSGGGAGELSLAKHGPHVTAVGNAAVALTLRDAASGATATLTRSFPTTNRYTLTPDIKSIRSAIDDLANNQGIILSRREILRFVTATPGNRSAEVTTLLNLERLREVGKQLNSASSGLAKEQTTANDAVERELRNVHVALQLDSPSPKDLVAAVNSHRSTLSLGPLTTIDSSSQVSPMAGTPTLQQAFNKQVAATHIDRLRTLCNEKDTTVADTLIQAVMPFRDDPALLNLAESSDFYGSGLARIVDNLCPLCDREWDTVEELKTHIRGKVAAAQNAVNSRAAVLAAMGAADNIVKNTKSATEPLKAIATAIGALTIVADLDSWVESLSSRSVALQDLVATLAVGNADLRHLTQYSVDRSKLLDDLSTAVSMQPDEDPADAARSVLIGLQLTLNRWKGLEAEAADAAQAAKVASLLAGSYTSIQEGSLTKLYEEVEADFSKYYRYLNSDDESTFNAKFTQSSTSLKLEVDFYEKGTYPPGALHSEGHQDSMGICLYLALMRKVLGAELGILVLDDVVMSVDTGHRQRLTELLNEEFSDVQFVMTTHDRVWANEMRTAQLVTGAGLTRFWGWKVGTGPITSDGPDFWDLIEKDLTRNDLDAAAARLRRNLEATLSDLTVNLQGKVRFKPDGGYDLGDFKDAVRERHKRLLDKALKAAKSHGQQDKAANIVLLKTAFQEADAVKEASHSAVNPMVHFNSWANYTEQEFRRIVTAWKLYLATLRCGGCSKYVRVEASGGDGVLKCSCGDWNLNLTSKSANG